MNESTVGNCIKRSRMNTISVRDLKTRLKQDPFNPDEFVQSLCIHCTREDLEECRQKVQAVSDETAQDLKMNVYKNYQQFIETSKDVSQLESEMYQISHILHEQEQLFSPNNKITSLALDNNLQMEGREAEAQEQKEEPRSLAYLLEIVEGCSHLTDVPGRCVVFSGNLREIDPDTGEEMRKVRAFLLNDSLLIATHLRKRQRRGPVQFRFQSLIELDNLAVVLVKDSGSSRSNPSGGVRLRNAFKILKFPDSHLYSADFPEQKRQWISILEDTKKKYKAARAKMKNSTDRKMSLEESVASSRQKSMKQKQMALLQEDWIKEMPEQLDVLIAQRDFEKAVEQVERAKSFLKDFTDSHALRDVRSRIDLRIKQLGESLKQELRVSRGASLRGGPRASRRAVVLLLRLDRSAQACELFLKNRSCLMRYDMKQQKGEGSTAIFIDKLSRTFFVGLQDTSSEFQQAFGGEGSEKGAGANITCYSTFVVWCVQELKYFSVSFCKEVFKTPDLEKSIECVEIALYRANKLHEIGLDLGHAFLLAIKTKLLDQLKSSADDISYSLPSISSTSAWLPYDLIKDLTMLKTITDKMVAIGISDFLNEVYEDGVIDLTQATINFCVSLYDFTKSSLKITLPELYDQLQECLVELVRSHNTVLSEVLAKESDRNMKAFLLKSMRFMFATVIPCFENWIEDETGRVTLRLGDCRLAMEQQHKDLKDDGHLELPKKRSSVYHKTSVIEDDEI